MSKKEFEEFLKEIRATKAEIINRGIKIKSFDDFRGTIPEEHHSRISTKKQLTGMVKDHVDKWVETACDIVLDDSKSF